MNIKDIKCWVITEGMIGTENQCLGVTDALGITPEIKHIAIRQPWKTLTPWLGFEQSFTFTEPLIGPWPDLVIASGRKAVAASRYIKKKSGGKTFTVQIQDPQCSPSHFDLVAVPHHDSLRGENVIVTDGAPNRITNIKLQDAKEEFSSLFETMSSPRLAVLIGGNSRTHKITPEIMQILVAQLKTIDANLMITASRRTGEENLRILQSNLEDKISPSPIMDEQADDLKYSIKGDTQHLNPVLPPKSKRKVFIWDGTGANPYHGMLAWAHHILVTSDSVSMISDAATTGKPIHIIALDGGSTRFDKFHNHMQGLDVARPFVGNLTDWTYEPLSDATKIANAIKQAMQKMYG